MPNFTPEQRAAIDARGTNLLLSAAAGSGKTTVLVERVLDLIEHDDAQLDRLLVVTFTRAAASDMRAKLSAKLAERAGGENGQKYLEQLNALERASISTLHSFCSDFLHTYFEAADVDPAFKILDEVTAERLLDEALTETLEEAYAEGGEDLLALDYGRGPRQVKELTYAMCEAMETRPDAEAWLEQIGSNDIIGAWLDEIKREARRAAMNALTYLNAALELPDMPAAYTECVLSDIDVFTDILEKEHYEELRLAIKNISYARQKPIKKVDPETKAAFKALRDAAKGTVKSLKIKDIELAPAMKDAEALVPQIRLLGELARKTMARLAEKKAEIPGLTYNDLEHKTLKALRNDDVARQAQEKYDYIFIDEYQDTSDIQEAIVGRICRGDNVFMVGDVKQSIYRFRHAVPRLFIEKYYAYKNGDGGQLLPLTRNFRSRKAILDFVNMIFERVMTGGDSEIEYDDLARLNLGKEDAPYGDLVEIHVIDTLVPDAEEEEEAPYVDEDIEALASAEQEGLFIAQRIRAMMQDDASLRYRDFAVLTRVASNVATSIMTMLLEMGIPAYSDNASGYFDALEVRAALSLMRLVASRRSDVDLLGALRLPMVGLTAEQLAQIRIDHRDGAFADAAWQAAFGTSMGTFPGEGVPLPAGDAAASMRAFFIQLEEWRTQAGAVGTGRLLRQILDDTGLMTYVGALPGGAQRQANLNRLISLATQFDADNSGSVLRFLRYAEQLESRGDNAAAHLLSENDDVVRLMTIHKSKGLEFRVVFGAQLARKFRAGRVEALAVNERLGMGMSYYDPVLGSCRRTVGQTAIALAEGRSDKAEELRILYVLLTRAQERLILVGSVKGMERRRKVIGALKNLPMQAGNHLDLILAVRAAVEEAGANTYSTLQAHTLDELSMAKQRARDDVTRLQMLMRGEGIAQDEAREREMQWQYPEPDAALRPLKLSVSGLLREIEGPGQLPKIMKRPAFLEESSKRMTAAERGTAYHRAMQLLDWTSFAGLSLDALSLEIARQIADFVAAKRMTSPQAEVIRAQRLADFWAGDLGRRIMAAEQVEREWSFNVLLTAGEVLDEEEAGHFGDAPITVQGTIDCCFLEDGEWVLLDYKTDRGDDLEAIRQHYEKQLKAYALALERITGVKVKEQRICLIGQGKEVEIIRNSEFGIRNCGVVS